MCLYHVIGLHTTANTMVGLDRYHTGDWYRILLTGAVSILEMMLHSSDICTILTTHGRGIMLTATSSSEMCGDDFAVTLHGRRRCCPLLNWRRLWWHCQDIWWRRRCRAVSIVIRLIRGSDSVHSIHTWRCGCACVLWMESLLLISWIMKGEQCM